MIYIYIYFIYFNIMKDILSWFYISMKCDKNKAIRITIL